MLKTLVFINGAVDWLDRFDTHRKNIWFVIRYSNGAYQKHELERWTCKELTDACRHLKHWFDTEAKNSVNG